MCFLGIIVAAASCLDSGSTFEACLCSESQVRQIKVYIRKNDAVKFRSYIFLCDGKAEGFAFFYVAGRFWSAFWWITEIDNKIFPRRDFIVFQWLPAAVVIQRVLHAKINFIKSYEASKNLIYLSWEFRKVICCDFILNRYKGWYFRILISVFRERKGIFTRSTYAFCLLCLDDEIRRLERLSVNVDYFSAEFWWVKFFTFKDNSVINKSCQWCVYIVRNLWSRCRVDSI